MRPVNSVILIVIDDLQADHFNKFLKDGYLPNIEKYLMNGLFSNNMVACYPAITIPAQPVMLTGVYPDAYIPPGGHWVKRDELIIRNYNTFKEYSLINDELGDVKTIFELVRGNTTGLFLGLNRGSKQIYPTKRQVFWLYLWYFLFLRRSISQANTLIINKLLNYFNKPKKFFKNNEPPRLSVAWFLSSDSMLHNYGSTSEQYLKNLRDIDLKIGELINGKGKKKGLKDLGYLDDTVIILTSDHGNYTASKWIDIAPYFDQIGLIPLKPKIPEGNFDATFGSLGFFTLKGNTWQERPTIEQMQQYGPKKIDLFKALMNIPGVKYLYYREDGNTFEKGLIHILYKEQNDIYSASINYEGDKTKYIYEEKDVFGYSKDEIASKILDQQFHSIDEWLKHTYHVDFPMIIDQITRLFRNPNSCDIMLSTCGETIFNYEHGRTKNAHIHGHDIGLHSAMSVPLLISGSQIPQKKLLYAKSADITPTILKLLGEPVPSNLVGKSIL